MGGRQAGDGEGRRQDEVETTVQTHLVFLGLLWDL
jgi:hypothetical protein